MKSTFRADVILTEEGNTTTLYFRDAEIVDDSHAQRVGSQLLELPAMGYRRVLVDLNPDDSVKGAKNVRALSDLLLTRFMQLTIALRSEGGCLMIACRDAAVREFIAQKNLAMHLPLVTSAHDAQHAKRQA